MIALILVAFQAATADKPAETGAPIVVEGKKACRTVVETGSRARRVRVCQTPDEQMAAREQSREAFREGAEQIRTQRASCAATSTLRVC